MKKIYVFVACLCICIIKINGQTPWYTSGNSIGTGDFLGTTTAKDLVFKVNGLQSGFIGYDVNKANTGLGYQILKGLTTGFNNSAFGYNTLSSNTAGNNNSGFGYSALYLNTTGGANCGFGEQHYLTIQAEIIILASDLKR